MFEESSGFASLIGSGRVAQDDSFTAFIQHVLKEGLHMRGIPTNFLRGDMYILEISLLTHLLCHQIGKLAFVLLFGHRKFT